MPSGPVFLPRDTLCRRCRRRRYRHRRRCCCDHRYYGMVTQYMRGHAVVFPIRYINKQTIFSGVFIVCFLCRDLHCLRLFLFQARWISTGLNNRRDRSRSMPRAYDDRSHFPSTWCGPSSNRPKRPQTVCNVRMSE